MNDTRPSGGGARTRTDPLRIANAGGYWGDDPYALRRQVLGELDIDYVSIDFLAEITMSILNKQYQRNPEAGYARDFVTQIAPLLGEIRSRGIRVITNAGGVNPEGCARALFAAAQQQGVSLKIAVVSGDNIADRIADLRRQGVDLSNMETGESLDENKQAVLSANVYFGALPVVEALGHEPDIVLSGRVTDTGITLAALIHEFGWSADDYDRLAHGIVGAHLIECGAQATGGNFTDWTKVPSFENLGFPILEFESTGSFVVTKHPGSGGLVSLQTVREQFVYEMGEPHNYVTPDVIADFTTMTLSEDGDNRVRVSGATGREPTDELKVSMALEGGYKSSGAIIVSGPDAGDKARCFADVFWARCDDELSRAGLSAFSATQTERVGDDATHRHLTPRYHPFQVTEVLLRLGARDDGADAKAKLQIFRKLLPSLILSGPAGVAVTGGAPVISQVVRYWPTLIPQAVAPSQFALWTNHEGRVDEVYTSERLHWPETGGRIDQADVPGSADDNDERAVFGDTDDGNAETIEVPLMAIAHARSGDKGDMANVGLIGRSAECYLWLRRHVSAELVQGWFGAIVRGEVRRFAVPNLWALNFLLDESLGGGGTVSLHIDAQGKTYSQALLRCRVDVPRGLLDTIRPQDAASSLELREFS